jgi:hypothetical protein
VKPNLPLLLVLIALLGGGLWLASSVDGIGESVGMSPDEPVGPPSLQAELGQPVAKETDEARPPDRTSLSVPSRLTDERPQQDAAGEDAPSAQLTLTVLDRTTGAPVVGLYANFEPLLAPGEEKSASSAVLSDSNETDLDGKFTAELEPGQALQYEVLFIGFEPLLHEGVLEPFVSGEERELEVRVDSSRVRRHFVRVVDHVTDEVILGARIVAVDRFGHGLHMEGPLEFSAWRDRRPLGIVGSDGVAELPVSRLVQKRYAALADGYAPGVFEQAQGADTREYADRIGLLRGAALKVSVSDTSGYPVSAATVGFDTKFTELQARGSRQSVSGFFGTHSVLGTTNSAGEASFTGLPAAEEYDLFVVSSITGGQSVPVDFVRPDLTPGETASVDLVVRPLGSLVGIAVDGSGAPVPNTDLVLRRDRGDEGLLMGPHAAAGDRPITTDEDGAFTLERIPSGDWRLGPPGIQVEPVEPSEETPPSGRFVPTFKKITVNGEQSPGDLRLDLDRGSWIEGVVLDASDQPVDHAFVRATLGDVEFFWGNTGPNGRFRLGPLPTSKLELTAEAWEQGECPPTPALPGGDLVELRLVLGGSLSLRTVEGAKSQEVACRFEFRRHGEKGEVLTMARLVTHGGTVEDYSLSPGRWSVLAFGPNDLMAFASGIDIEAGSAVGPMELSLESAGDIVIQRSPGSSRGAFDVDLRRDGFVFARHTIPAGEPLKVPVPAGPIEISVAGAAERNLTSVTAGGQASVVVDTGERAPQKR